MLKRRQTMRFLKKVFFLIIPTIINLTPASAWGTWTATVCCSRFCVINRICSPGGSCTIERALSYNVCGPVTVGTQQECSAVVANPCPSLPFGDCQGFFTNSTPAGGSCVDNSPPPPPPPPPPGGDSSSPSPITDRIGAGLQGESGLSGSHGYSQLNPLSSSQGRAFFSGHATSAFSDWEGDHNRRIISHSYSSGSSGATKGKPADSGNKAKKENKKMVVPDFAKLTGGAASKNEKGFLDLYVRAARDKLNPLKEDKNLAEYQRMENQRKKYKALEKDRNEEDKNRAEYQRMENERQRNICKMLPKYCEENALRASSIIAVYNAETKIMEPEKLEKAVQTFSELQASLNQLAASPDVSDDEKAEFEAMAKAFGKKASESRKEVRDRLNQQAQPAGSEATASGIPSRESAPVDEVDLIDGSDEGLIQLGDGDKDYLEPLSYLQDPGDSMEYPTARESTEILRAPKSEKKGKSEYIGAGQGETADLKVKENAQAPQLKGNVLLTQDEIERQRLNPENLEKLRKDKIDQELGLKIMPGQEEEQAEE